MAISAQESRLAAIGEAAARVLRRTDYEAVRADEVAAEVRVPSTGDGRGDRMQTRSTVWFYSETKNRRVWVALAAFHAWRQFLTELDIAQPKAPESTIDARLNLVRAMNAIARFHQAERTLMKQVARGIGDISTSEKRSSSLQSGRARDRRNLEWSDGPWGKVAQGGLDFACVAFSDFLIPIIKSSLEAVTYLGDKEIERQADLLSDLAFRAYTTNLGAKAGHLPDGLAAYWFEGNLVDVAGEWIHDLELLERRLKAGPLQAEATARAALIELFLMKGTLYRRCMREGETIERLSAEAVSGDGRFSPREAEILCDVASRFGLSLLRWGDFASAVSAFERSSEIAHQYFDADPSRLTRSQMNLGEVFSELGNLPEAISLADAAVAERTRIADDCRDPDSPGAEWRRLTVAHQTRAVIAYRAGHVIDGVQRAMRLVADRRSKLTSENLNTASARAVLGEALLEAGHPQEARQAIWEAQAVRAERLPATSHGIQNDTLVLSRAELALGNFAEAVKLLQESPVLTKWFAERVSFRLSYEARRHYALGLTESFGPDRGIAELVTGITELRREHQLLPSDPLARSYQKDLAQILLTTGEARRARDVLAEIDEQETEEGRLCLPAHARTLLLLARTAGHRADRDAMRHYFQRLGDLADDGIDASHPTLLAGRYGEAVWHLDHGGEPARARWLLAALLDDQPLAHGLTALGEGHWLLSAARRQAHRAGLGGKASDEDGLWAE